MNQRRTNLSWAVINRMCLKNFAGNMDDFYTAVGGFTSFVARISDIIMDNDLESFEDNIDVLRLLVIEKLWVELISMPEVTSCPLKN